MGVWWRWDGGWYWCLENFLDLLQAVGEVAEDSWICAVGTRAALQDEVEFLFQAAEATKTFLVQFWIEDWTGLAVESYCWEPGGGEGSGHCAEKRCTGGIASTKSAPKWTASFDTWGMYTRKDSSTLEKSAAWL